MKAKSLKSPIWRPRTSTKATFLYWRFQKGVAFSQMNS
jgi:hypothetical protein